MEDKWTGPGMTRLELLGMMNSRDFYEVLEGLVAKELELEGRADLSIEAELARIVAVAVRTSVELMLIVTGNRLKPASRIPADIMSAPSPVSNMPTDRGEI
jgi:hypothetical protein